MTDPFFETAAISLCSGPPVCLPPRSFLPLRLIAAGQPRLLRPSRTCVVASACIGYANHPLRTESRGNDCLKKGANCQTCCPISTTLEGRAARQRPVLEPFDNESHSRKAGAEVARHRCICQHQRGEGPGWIPRSPYAKSRQRRK